MQRKNSRHSHFYIFKDGRFFRITEAILLKEFRSETADVGEKRLGFKAEYIGIDSLRSESSMETFLENVPILLIILADIWYLDEF